LRRLGGVSTHTKLLHDTKLKSKDFADCIETMRESNALNCVIDKDSKAKHYILNSKNPQNPKSPQHLLVSKGTRNEEMLETLNNINKLDNNNNGDNKDDNNYIDKEIKYGIIKEQSNNTLSLQNLSRSGTVGEQEISEMLGILEISQQKLMKHLYDFKRANYSTISRVNPNPSDMFTVGFLDAHPLLYKSQVPRVTAAIEQMNRSGWR